MHTDSDWMCKVAADRTACFTSQNSPVALGWQSPCQSLFELQQPHFCLWWSWEETKVNACLRLQWYCVMAMQLLPSISSSSSSMHCIRVRHCTASARCSTCKWYLGMGCHLSWLCTIVQLQVLQMHWHSYAREWHKLTIIIWFSVIVVPVPEHHNIQGDPDSKQECL